MTKYLGFRSIGVVFSLLALLVIGQYSVAQSGGASGGRGGFGSGFPDLGGFPGALPGAGDEEDRPEVLTEILATQKRVAPGSEFAIGIVLDHARNWHTWPSEAQDVLPASVAEFAIRTAIIPVGERPEWVDRAGPIQWPEPKEVSNPLMDPPTVKSYAGRAVAYIPVIVSADAELGTRTLEFTVLFQACDDTQCLQPEEHTLSIDIEIVSLDDLAGTGGAAGADFEKFDPTVFAEMRSGDGFDLWGEASARVAQGSRPSFLGFVIPDLGGAGGLVLLGLFAMLGGFILNLTPCVLPVIPIKIMTISQHAQSPGKSLVLGLWMALGVVAFWVGIGVPAAIFSAFADPSRIFGIWWITMGIGVLIAAMALGLMGMFEIRLPRAVYMVEPRAENAWGSFLFGVMTAVLGLPCFGFVAGALLAGAATMPAWQVMLIFTGIGVGMALPYLVLSANPKLLKKMPKAGPASDLVKQVMGLLLLAAGAYFIGAGTLALLPSVGVVQLPWWGTVVHWWLVALFAVAAGGWLIVRTVAITPKWGRRVAFGVVGLLLGGAAVAYAGLTTKDARENFWVPYSEEALAQHRAAGRTVVMDFTAEWCLNCKALKRAVLNVNPVRTELLRSDVVAMTVDLTSTNAPGWDKLRELGYTGIPVLVIYGPETDGPWSANAYTSGQVMEAIGRARGRTASAGAVSQAGDGSAGGLGARKD